MSMECYSGEIEFTSSFDDKFSFLYAFDNEVCPSIVIPSNWRECLNNEKELVNMVDYLLQDSFDDDFTGLKDYIESFDDCYPFDDLKSGPKYENFLRNVAQNCGRIKKISIRIYNNDKIQESKTLET